MNGDKGTLVKYVLSKEGIDMVDSETEVCEYVSKAIELSEVEKAVGRGYVSMEFMFVGEYNRRESVGEDDLNATVDAESNVGTVKVPVIRFSKEFGIDELTIGREVVLGLRKDPEIVFGFPVLSNPLCRFTDPELELGNVKTLVEGVPDAKEPGILVIKLEL